MTVPVYLFTGFLESGKTTLIKETLLDTGFNTGERTLLLACEEGMEAVSYTHLTCHLLFKPLYARLIFYRQESVIPGNGILIEQRQDTLIHGHHI